MPFSRLVALLPMHWLSNVRLPQARRCSHGAQQRWRIGLDDDNLIALVEPLPDGSQAAGDDWGGDWLSPAGVDLQINGGLGLAFPELSAADLPRLGQLLEHRSSACARYSGPGAVRP